MLMVDSSIAIGFARTLRPLKMDEVLQYRLTEGREFHHHAGRQISGVEREIRPSKAGRAAQRR